MRSYDRLVNGTKFKNWNRIHYDWKPCSFQCLCHKHSSNAEGKFIPFGRRNVGRHEHLGMDAGAGKKTQKMLEVANKEERLTEKGRERMPLRESKRNRFREKSQMWNGSCANLCVCTSERTSDRCFTEPNVFVFSVTATNFVDIRNGLFVTKNYMLFRKTYIHVLYATTTITAPMTTTIHRDAQIS